MGNKMSMFGLILKPVFTISDLERKVRLIRLTRNRPWGLGGWTSRQLSINLRPGLFVIERSKNDLRLLLLGIELHMKQTFGGHWPD